MGSVPFSSNRGPYNSGLSTTGSPFDRLADSSDAGPILLENYGTGSVSTASEINPSGTALTLSNGFAINSTYSLVSTDAADAAAGGGAQTVKIWYLDASFAVQSVSYNMNGLVSVPVTEGMMPFYMEVTAVGANTINVGTISLTPSGGPAGSNMPMYIGAFVGRSEHARIPVPAGFEAEITYLEFTYDDAAATPASLTVAVLGGDLQAVIVSSTAGKIHGRPLSIKVPASRVVTFVGSAGAGLGMQVAYKVIYTRTS